LAAKQKGQETSVEHESASEGKSDTSLTWSRAADGAGALLEGITIDTGIFSTVVREGGVDLAGEGFGSLVDAVFSKDNLALFARGTSSSSSELLEKQRRSSCGMT
jgi:hypothetical protein